MKAARLHGPKDIRIDTLDTPPAPGMGDVLIKVKAVGICGSDLHMYQDARIGDTEIPSPMVLGHEFMGEVVAVGAAAVDGMFQPLNVGQRVAVEPAIANEHHELFEKGHPNLVPAAFYGLYPDDGALQEQMIVRAKNCFPIPDSISDGAGTLLETLGVAIHAIDLGHLKLADTVAVVGCGPVGMLILKLAQLAGAKDVYAFDRLSGRVEKAASWGATAWQYQNEAQAVGLIDEATGGRGCDVVFEAAWADESINVSAEIARYGGRVVLVGIPGSDEFSMKHSTARRKGLSVMFSRRMKHTYPRAIALAARAELDLDDLVSHNVTLEDTPDAFKQNSDYEPGVNKIVIHLNHD